MSTLKRCKVVLFATDEKTRLQISKNYLNVTIDEFIPDNKFTMGQYLYIISNDEIEKDDYYLDYDKFHIKSRYGFDSTAVIEQCDDKGLAAFINKRGLSKKIIATTDKSIKTKAEQAGENAWYNPLPRPSEEFINQYVEEYNKGNIITDVIVEYVDIGEELWDEYRDQPFWKEKIVPKVNPKDNTITIRKVKDTWTKDEVIDLIYKFRNNVSQSLYLNKLTISNWLDDNQ